MEVLRFLAFLTYCLEVAKQQLMLFKSNRGTVNPKQLVCVLIQLQQIMEDSMEHVLFLSKKIGRNLLWIACRHLMFEVLLSNAFSVCFGQSTGPEILLFKRFRENWSKLNTMNQKSNQYL
ncbi:hypothetical protein AVEN_197318-1 [Araneus ventricosus]|uniref:Uncharacterized protein n=1 Tax=Araneus ventricosus TaxID=182803 RepID=A0A4Y2F0D1_ARAVE|nr:hypothetical protein AVEN_197318-1 [Araneus ventricosus]